MRAAVAHVDAFNHAVAQRSAALDHSPAHIRYVVTEGVRGSDLDLFIF